VGANVVVRKVLLVVVIFQVFGGFLDSSAEDEELSDESLLF
jgi:hypothetical protein